MSYKRMWRLRAYLLQLTEGMSNCMPNWKQSTLKILLMHLLNQWTQILEAYSKTSDL